MTTGKSTLLVRLSFLAFIIIFAVLVMEGRKNLYRLSQLRDVKRNLITETFKLVEENQHLNVEKESLKDPAYVEKISRESLGLVKKGETVYVVEEPKHP